jgi:hypothetical protein
MRADYSRTFDKDILPLLRKQTGFRTKLRSRFSVESM